MVCCGVGNGMRGVFEIQVDGVMGRAQGRGK